MSLPHRRLARAADCSPSRVQRQRRTFSRLRGAAFFAAGLGTGAAAALMAPVRVPRRGE